jgi:hypothetical protein
MITGRVIRNSAGRGLWTSLLTGANGRLGHCRGVGRDLGVGLVVGRGVAVGIGVAVEQFNTSKRLRGETSLHFH